MTRRWRNGAALGSLAALTALAVAACGGGTTADPAAPRTLRFAVIPKSLDLPVFNYAKIGAERAAAEIGHIEIIWRAPETADQLRQKEILESFITQRVDGIAISALNGDFLTDTINRAVDAGIPVVTWDSDAPKSKRQAFYGVDDFRSGRIMAEQAVTLLDGRGTLAVLTSLGATNLQRRLDGVRDGLAGHPNLRIVEVYDIKEDPVRVPEIIQTAAQRYPDLSAWISVGGWPVFTRNALAGINPDRTKFISFDTIAPALDLLRENKVQVLLGQKYFGWGAEPVRLLYNLTQGIQPPSPIIDSGVDVVTMATVEEYQKVWTAMESGGR